MSVAVADLWRRLVHNGPRKLAALAFAVIVWLFVTTDSTTTAQRSLLVPIVVEGVSAEQVVVGLPQVAEVTVSGPTGRIDRLRPESFEVVLDLSGLAGDFQVPLAVSPPQGIALEGVVPAEVIGIVEAVARTRVPVVASVLGDVGVDMRSRVTVTPAQAEVRGRAVQVARVVAVIVPLPVVHALAGSSLTAAGFAVDDDGRPLPEVGVEPSSFSLAWDLQRVWVERRLPIELAPLPPGPWSEPAGVPEEIDLLGPPGVLATLGAVEAEVELPTDTVEPGRYTLPLALRLPAGVVALQAPTATVNFEPPAAPE